MPLDLTLLLFLMVAHSMLHTLLTGMMDMLLMGHSKLLDQSCLLSLEPPPSP